MKLRALPLLLGTTLAAGLLSPVLAASSPAADTLLSLNKPTTTSSIETAELGGERAVDGDTTTRWGSVEGVDPQWLAVDLGGSATVNRVVLNWETAFATDYQIQVSADGRTWSTVKSVTGGDGGVDEITGLGVAARHVRVNGTRRATTYGYSLYEFSVYGARTGSGDIQPPTAPTGLTATATADTVSLSWTASTDNVGVTGYDVLRDGNLVGSATSTSFTDTGLTSGTTFRYTTRARDAAGNLSEESAPVSATTGNATGGVTIVATGDMVARCSGTSCAHVKTAKVAENIKPQHVITVGDNQYNKGTIEEFREFYTQSWAKFRDITKPTPGNHEYDDPKGKGAGYKQYFGNLATPQGSGKMYYSYDIGEFHFVALDSMAQKNRDRAQLDWLKADLANNQKRCVVGYWHHPRFNSGGYGDEPLMAPLWDEFVKAKADLVLSGHDHHYERLKPLNSSGKVDTVNGVRSALIGIGGDSIYSDFNAREGVEASAQKHGVMKLVLNGTSFSWEIHGINGTIIDRAGPYTCR
ncbi:hypothetical protein JOF53_002225 [Crossiella equi]|uniref:Alkaline phosphatase n=1 Tax=Crossiella equi TaxID=130796 RepID=A0ABS5A9V2_9PSEU|nr:discoidin domain-containing protein [Crossiella equi]MBP2473353.1 hypothetical protein [Crossiella equi]